MIELLSTETLKPKPELARPSEAVSFFTSPQLLARPRFVRTHRKPPA